MPRPQVLDDEYRNTGFCQATRAQGYSFDCEFRPHRPHLFVCTDRLQQAKSDHTCIYMACHGIFILWPHHGYLRPDRYGQLRHN